MVVHLIEILEGSDPSKYYDAVGRFVSMFSTVEEYMQRALWRCSGIAAPIAPAIFSGTRVDAASGYIKRIAEAQNWPKEEREELDEIVSQLSEITRLRNDILHYGANWSSPTELTVSNELLAHTPAKIR